MRRDGYDIVYDEFMEYWKKTFPDMDPLGSHYIKVCNKYDFDNNYYSTWLYIEIDFDGRCTFETDFDEGQQETHLSAVVNEWEDRIDWLWKENEDV